MWNYRRDPDEPRTWGATIRTILIGMWPIWLIIICVGIDAIDPAIR